MKTILILLGSLFVLSRLNGGGLVNTLGGNAAPGAPSFSPTPPSGAASSIIPSSGDPYGENLTGGAGGSGIPLTSGGAIGGGTSPGSHASFLGSRVVRSGVRAA